MLNDLFARFPDMKPIAKPPTLQNQFGIGTMAYGVRDHDPDTGTYVKTVWFTVVFLPLIPLGAYRVADAPNGGWYLLGKVPVSRPAKIWALCLVLALIAVPSYFTWSRYASTDSYRAGQKMAQADRLRQQGKLGEAAKLYREVADTKTDYSARAVQAVNAMLDQPELADKAAPVEATEVLRVAWQLRDQPGAVKDLFERGKKLADACSAANPATSLAFLEAVEPAAPKAESLLPARQKLLERLVHDQPENIDYVSRLAVVYEQTGQRDRCKALLEPLAKKLGTSEGARILGLLYFEQGKHDQAYALLQPYVEIRINALRDAEQKLATASKAAQEQIFQRLKDGTAKDFDVTRYKAAPEKKQDEMLGEFMTRHLKNNKELTRLQESYQSQLAVVSVVLDLGMLQLARGQRLTDVEERKAELERAEKTFLSVRSIAGEDPQYKLSLGQVYYWLGKQEEGRTLFEEVLKADGRKFESLLNVAHLLRELGAMADARSLLEEAYAKTGVELEKRQQAALMRAMSLKDLDDQISWLEKSNPIDPQVKALLAKARGYKALREGQESEAAKAFREAVAVYASQPESAATLNNGGGANLALYTATGERSALDAGIAMLEKGLALDPSNGIQMANVATTVLSAGLADVIGNRIDLAKLKQMAGVSDLAFLYLNHAERKVLARQLSDNARIKRVRTLFDRALILATNNAHLYSQYQQLLSFLDDREGLANLEHRAREATPDLADARQQMQDFWQGKNDAQTRKTTESTVARAERP